MNTYFAFHLTNQKPQMPLAFATFPTSSLLNIRPLPVIKTWNTARYTSALHRGSGSHSARNDMLISGFAARQMYKISWQRPIRIFLYIFIIKSVIAWIIKRMTVTLLRSESVTCMFHHFYFLTFQRIRSTLNII